MFNLKNLLIAQLAFASLAMAGSGPLEDGSDVCGVPVCSLEATTSALSELDENKRYNYTNMLVSSYKDSADINTLENLVGAANAIKDLTTEAGDADWVVREASTLLNNSIFNLAKYSDVDAANLIQLFAQLDNQTKRYEVISYWQNAVSEIENISDLSELVAFASQAANISASKGDEDWVPRAANSLASQITIKLTDLDPAHEGVYSVSITNAQSNKMGFDKVVILDSTSEKNLVVKFINSKFNKVAYEYSNAKIVGSKISGKMVSNASLSSTVELEYDRSSGAISGTIQTTQSTPIEFNGTQNFSASSVFAGEVAAELDEDSIVGEMNGSILGIPGTMSIRSFSPGVYSVHFAANNSLIVMDFVGKFFKKNGVLSVTYRNQVKLVMSLRVVDGQNKWTGNTFSTTNGSVTPVLFDAK
ncbi:MAG: hypothetical protein VYA54_10015 [Bdellovibrionota bacterium]|nr:hypothetical protein [Bdellovibrionota bacterium]